MRVKDDEQKERFCFSSFALYVIQRLFGFTSHRVERNSENAEGFLTMIVVYTTGLCLQVKPGFKGLPNFSIRQWNQSCKERLSWDKLVMIKAKSESFLFCFGVFLLTFYMISSPEIGKGWQSFWFTICKQDKHFFSQKRFNIESEHCEMCNNCAFAFHYTTIRLS